MDNDTRILRNCEWVDAEPKVEVSKKKKRGPRVVTPSMHAANVANSTRSTGPKSTSGKAASSRSSLQHGMTCKTFLFLAGENENEFWDDVNCRIKERGATTAEERDLIEITVYSRWTKRRAINASVTAINEERCKIRDDFDDGCVQKTRDLKSKIATAPDIAVDELSKSTSGCDFLIGQFQLLLQRLKAYYSTEVSQREYAIRLGGNRPDELFINPDVFDFNKAYFGAIAGPGGFNPKGAVNALQYDKPKDMSYDELARRLEPLVGDLPTIEEGNRRLKKYINEQIDRLTERKKLVGDREKRRLAAALGTAQAPVDHAAVTRARYAADSDRTFMSALRMLVALKKERRDHGDDGETAGPDTLAGAGSRETTEPAAGESIHDEPRAADTTSSAVVNAPGQVATPAETGEIRNEAVAPEVVGPTGGNNEDSAGQRDQSPAPVASPVDPLAALLEKYQKEIDKLGQYHPLE